jgi:integrase
MPRVTLTDRFVAHAKPGANGRAEYFDAGTPGLSLRVSEGGKKSWSFFFTSPKDGRRARLTLGSYPATTLIGARTRAIEAAGHIEDGRDPRDAFAARDASAMTVAMLADAYVAMHATPNLKPRTASNIEQRLKKNVTPIIGAVRLADLHARDVNRVVDPIVSRKRPTEGNRVFESMRAMFNWAVRRGDLDRNPMAGMVKPSVEKGSRERFLSDDEIRHMWLALPDALALSPTCQRILKLCLVTAQRVGEVAGMRVVELDLKKAIWTLPGSRTKNASAHTVPLSPLAAKIIGEALADAGEKAEFVFPSPVIDEDAKQPQRPLDPHAVATTLRRAHQPSKERPKGRFGMTPWAAHDLRRTALTGLAQLGVAPIVIGSVANHLSVTKSSVTFAHYVKHDYAREKAEALHLWADRLSGLIAGGAATVVPLQRADGQRP